MHGIFPNIVLALLLEYVNTTTKVSGFVMNQERFRTGMILVLTHKNESGKTGQILIEYPTCISSQT